MQRTSTMIDISDQKKMKQKSIKSKFSKMVKKVFTKKSSTPVSEAPGQIITASVPTKRKNDDFDVEKWRKNLAKTCHDYDKMNATTYSLKSRSRNDETFASARSNGSVYREELQKMKSEIADLQRQKEQLQRGLMIRGASQRKSQRYKNQRSKRNTYRSQAIGYQSDSGEKLRRAPKKRLSGYYSGSSYDSNDSNCFYVFL